MTIDDVITEVDTHESGIRELVVEPGARIENGDALTLGGSSYHLTNDGFRRFCDQLSAPAEYLSALPADIRQLALQHHLNRCDFNNGRVSAIVRGDEFRAFSRPDLYRLKSCDVLTAVQEGANVPFTVKSLAISDDSFQLNLLIESESEEISVGDVVSAGVQVCHSMIGDHATRIESYVFRLVCQNGLTRRDCVQSKELSRTRRQPVERCDARDVQIGQVRRLTSETCRSLRSKLQAIRRLKDEQVDAIGLMSRFLEQGGMSTRLWLPRLRQAWEMEGSEPTAYGVMNAMTRIATHGLPHLGVSARQRRVLGGLAGILAFRELHICPRCFSAVKNAPSNN